MKNEQLVFRITSVMRAVEKTVGLGDVDPFSRSILCFIGEAESEQRKLNVSDIVKAASFGTPPTVYGRLNQLQGAGWIEYEPDPSDGRAKQVFLSPAARRAFGKVSRKIQKSLEL